MPHLLCGEKKLIVGEVLSFSRLQKDLLTKESNLSDNEKSLLINIPERSNPVLILLTTKE